MNAIMKKPPEPWRPEATVAELALRLGCEFEGDGATVLTGVADLSHAGPGDLVFMAQKKFRPQLATTGASAVILLPGEEFDRIPVLRSRDPHLSFVQAQEFFFTPYRPQPGVHSTAQVSASARIGRDVSIGAYSWVGDEVEIGDRAVIFPLVVIQPRVKIGSDCLIRAHVSLREDVVLGRRVILHDGVVIGSDGFGYLETETGERKKIPQQGTVILEDDVEIGANSTIDRGTLGATVIRKGVKIDNLVQIAHNVEIGENSVVVSQVGIAGSSKVGKNVILAGQAGISDHVEIGDNVMVAAKTGVTKSIPAGRMVSGSPHLDIRVWRKAWAAIPQLYDLLREVKQLRKKVDRLMGSGTDNIKGSD
jgi:UDP-3-O-[3-hydroxymyristoyl] glucosamine N-acyltransferase